MKKNKILIGIICGAIAGIIDIIPMIIQNLSIDANISAFAMWVVIGFLLSIIRINLPSILKGIIVSFSVLAPSAILIGWNDPLTLVPIFIMTIVLGSLLGFVIGKLIKE